METKRFCLPDARVGWLLSILGLVLAGCSWISPVAGVNINEGGRSTDGIEVWLGGVDISARLPFGCGGNAKCGSYVQAIGGSGGGRGGLEVGVYQNGLNDRVSGFPELYVRLIK